MSRDILIVWVSPTSHRNHRLGLATWQFLNSSLSGDHIGWLTSLKSTPPSTKRFPRRRNILSPRSLFRHVSAHPFPISLARANLSFLFLQFFFLSNTKHIYKFKENRTNKRIEVRTVFFLICTRFLYQPNAHRDNLQSSWDSRKNYCRPSILRNRFLDYAFGGLVKKPLD